MEGAGRREGNGGRGFKGKAWDFCGDISSSCLETRLRRRPIRVEEDRLPVEASIS